AGDSKIGSAGLGDVGALVADRNSALVARSYDRDMARLVIMMIPVCRNNEVAAIRVALRIDSVADQLPAMLRSLIRQPVILGVRQQQLRMFGRTQDINAELLRRGRNEGAAVGVLAST